jgi:dTDP-4-amino-4,6-dideoxygalactose transaminase
MDAITVIAERHGLAVVEDNAHGLGGTYRGRPLGSLGSMATQSFHATKNIQCGEGGAIVLNDPAYLERAEIIREKGTNRSQFFRGEVDKYRWVDIGSSYLPSDLLAAFLTAQLESFKDIQHRRCEAWDHYDRELATWADGVVRTPTVPDDREHPAHLYYLILPDPEQQERFIRHLGDAGVLGVFHYVPLDSAPVGRERGRTAPGGCPVSADLSARLVRLPLFPDLTERDLSVVVEAVTSFQVAT